jgi:hypothetical protein
MQTAIAPTKNDVSLQQKNSAPAKPSLHSPAAKSIQRNTKSKITFANCQAIAGQVTSLTPSATP